MENRRLGSALWAAVREAHEIEILAPATVRAMEVEDSAVKLQLTLEDERELELAASLVIAADGARSQIRELAGVGATTWDYDQAALVANLATRKPHHSIAFERFTDTGLLALLPMTHNRCNLVWTVPSAAVGELLDLDEQAFLARLQCQFGYRLGQLRRVGERQAYPLALVRVDEPTGPRVVFVGNAAQGLHPVAGQGFNLGLRDVAAVAEVLAEAIAERGAQDRVPDLGNGRVLERYRTWRQDDRRSVMAFTDSLVRLFRNPLAPVKAGRNLGLLTLDLLPAAKQALARQAMGRAGRLPRLARGVPLT